MNNYVDSLFNASMRIIAQPLLDECDRFVDECEKDDVIVPDSLPKKIHRTIIKEKITRIRSTAFAVGKRAAVAVVIFAAVFMAACASIKPLRENIFNAIVTWCEEYFTFAFDEKTDGNAEAKVVKFNYLPEGYAVTSDKTIGDYREVLIENDENLIAFLQRPCAENDDMLDEQLTVLDELEINDRDVIFMTDGEEKNKIFTWVEGGYWYMINSDIEYSELVKIIENLY